MKASPLPAAVLGLFPLTLALPAQDARAFRPDDLPEAWSKPAAPAKAEAPRAQQVVDLATLKQLLADKDVIMVKAARVFLAGRDGKAPAIVDGRKSWLAYKGGAIVGLFQEPDTPLEIAKDELKARLVDFAKDHPTSFASPGLVDADGRWFVSDDPQATMAVSAADLLETWQPGWEALLDAGITTVFVPAATASQSSGPGALVALEPAASDVQAIRKDGALFFRLSTLTTKGTSLTRIAAVKALRSALEATKNYREAQEKWTKDLAEYEKKRKEFLAYYEKNPMKPGDKNEQAAAPSGERRGRGSMNREEMMRIMRLPPEQRQEAMRKLREQSEQKPEEEKKPEAAPGTTSAKGAPPRPTYPKKPDPDPAKDAMLAVLDGKATLRIEAHRIDEIRALLELAREFSLSRLAIVGATEAWKIADEVRAGGASVVLTPQTLPDQGFATLTEHLAAAAGRLAAAGVPVAFGSAGTERGAMLPLCAARAVALGMAPEQALQALTVNGLAAAGTVDADSGIVVFSDDPLAPGARPLCVARGSKLHMMGGGK